MVVDIHACIICYGFVGGGRVRSGELGDEGVEDGRRLIPPPHVRWRRVLCASLLIESVMVVCSVLPVHTQLCNLSALALATASSSGGGELRPSHL